MRTKPTLSKGFSEVPPLQCNDQKYSVSNSVVQLCQFITEKNVRTLRLSSLFWHSTNRIIENLHKVLKACYVLPFFAPPSPNIKLTIPTHARKSTDKILKDKPEFICEFWLFGIMQWKFLTWAITSPLLKYIIDNYLVYFMS